MTTTVIFYATDTMADWEYGYLLAGLAMANEQAPGAFRVLVASEDGGAVTSMGGMRVTPEVSLGRPGPGRDRGARAARRRPRGSPVTRRCWRSPSERWRPAAWWPRSAEPPTVWPGPGCWTTATTPATRPTSSPAPPGTAAPHRYREARAVHDRGLITAPATAPVDFASAVFEALAVFPEPVIEAWYGLYTTGERRFYDALVGA